MNDDLISRQAVLEQARNYGSNTYLIPVNSVKTLPSVQPERPTARWIESPNGVYVECSICATHWEKGFVEHCNMQYCPKCGARMEGIA